ncbi:MAG: hypothetical protein HUJ25_13125 [Crocinitomicaceae bacterium]|nr:hypothetical protein [Crocinitomicaceae bacterium]
MKKALAVFWCCCIITIVHAQQNIETQKVSVKESNPTAWTTYISNNYVKIDYRFVECDPPYGYDAQYILIRITNLSHKPFKLSWHHELYYGNDCTTCGYTDEYGFEVTAEGNVVLEGSCGYEDDFQLKIFSRFTDKAYKGGAKPLSAFQFNNLTLTFI